MLITFPFTNPKVEMIVDIVNEIENPLYKT